MRSGISPDARSFLVNSVETKEVVGTLLCEPLYTVIRLDLPSAPFRASAALRRLLTKSFSVMVIIVRREQATTWKDGGRRCMRWTSGRELVGEPRASAISARRRILLWGPFGSNYRRS